MTRIPFDAVELRIDVTAAPDAVGFDVVLEESTDHGVTWAETVRWSFNDPTTEPRFGAVQGAHDVPLCAGPGHRARARVVGRADVLLSLTVK